MRPDAGQDTDGRPDDPRVTSPYLEVLEDQRAALITALAPVVSADDVAQARRLAARLSVRLDASPLEDATADAVDRGALGVPASRVDRREESGWAAALRLDGMPTQDIAAIEYRGVRAALADEPDLASRFFDGPVATLVQVQRRVASGLLTDERLGTLRRTTRAVHDGAQGRVIFHAPSPDRLPDLLAGYDDWVRAARARHTPLIVAGFVHARVLHWRPFEAGNGRVARIASRVALRASGGDPWGLAVPEHSWSSDPLRYATEVAATIRRRSDLRPWNELTGEAIVASLEHRARRRRLLPHDVDVRAVRVVAALEADATITVPELAAAADLDRMAALVQCNRLCWTGMLQRDMGSRGLRYERPSADVSDRAGNNSDV